MGLLWWTGHVKHVGVSAAVAISSSKGAKEVGVVVGLEWGMYSARDVVDVSKKKSAEE